MSSQSLGAKQSNRVRAWLNKLRRMVSRNKFVDAVGLLMGVSSFLIGIFMLVVPQLFTRTPTWSLVFAVAQPWLWGLVLLVCGVFLTAGSMSDHSSAAIPAAVLAWVYVMFGVMITMVGSPVGVISFGTLSIIMAMTFKVYMNER